ncbi:glycoside hydrolase family 18 protein [Xylariomycetidae sp. FL2044]|nr:glycoside hydrolase family 18 protein [Xylariomycetidae sp. FL2044]
MLIINLTLDLMLAIVLYGTSLAARGIYGRNYHVSDLPASKINQVLYAFAKIEMDGSVYPSDTWSDIEQHYSDDSWNDVGYNAYGHIKQLYHLKQVNRHLKVLLSIRGWTYSKNFPAASNTMKARSTFARSAVAIMKDWGFDGIDIDWEYPNTKTEADNMVSLLRSVRQELDSYSGLYGNGSHFLLTAAVPAGVANYEKMKLSQMVPLLDQFNLMAYDYAGSWDDTSGHQANLYVSTSNPTATKFSTNAAITAYVAARVPARKLMLGILLYGRSFESTKGIGQTYSGIGKGSWEVGVWDVKALPRLGAVEQYDNDAGATYSYDETTGELVFYNNKDMVKEKIEYIQAWGLGGSMFWEAAGDRIGSDSLIAISYVAQGGDNLLDKSPNCLSYPNSQYNNIRSNLS